MTPRSTPLSAARSHEWGYRPRFDSRQRTRAAPSPELSCALDDCATLQASRSTQTRLTAGQALRPEMAALAAVERGLRQSSRAPPATGISESPANFIRQNTIRPSTQLAPRALTASARSVGGPLESEIFLSFPLAKNPSHWPSCEKNGPSASSVPGIELDSTLSSMRRNSWERPPSRPRYASRVPSGHRGRVPLSGDSDRGVLRPTLSRIGASV